MPYPCTNVPLIRIGVPCHTETNQTSKTLDGLRLKFPIKKKEWGYPSHSWESLP